MQSLQMAQVAPVALWVVIMLVALALVFDFMNGFHDAANSIATVVSTGVLKPQQAVAFAAFFNVVAIAVFQLKVAATVGKGIVDPGVVDQYVVFGALVGAIAWNVLTWWYGIPSSSSHALIGGIVGATIAKAGVAPLIGAGIGRTLAFIFVSPMMGFLLGSLLMVAVAWICRRTSPLRVDNFFRRAQLVSAGLYSLGHGGNDAQKTIGIIWLLLITAGITNKADATPPSWVIWTCYLAIGLGTMFGGWRIVKTMGQRITKLKPVGGFALKRVVRSRCSPPRPWGFRCLPRTPSRAPFTVWARCAVCPPCAGVWPAISCWPGSSPSRPRPSSLRCSITSAPRCFEPI